MDADQNRLKKIELLGSLGAGILGAGLALLLTRWLEHHAVAILMVGIACHGWAMFAKRRLESKANKPRPAWVVAAETFCWLMIMFLLAYIIVATLGRW